MKKSGFTLIELSVVIAIIGVILYGSMSILVVGVKTFQINSTVATMDAIEKALLDYRVAFGRIPCPSDLIATASSANYGVEAANQGSCTGGSPAANFVAASGTAEGGVPTRALRLPDSYMYDGWGHKFRYAVNPNYTVTTSTSCSLSTNPAITVNDASGAARSTKAIYAIVSHGANGHGAYTSNGVVANAGSTNTDELTNCHCDSTGAANTYSPTYVQKAPTIDTAGSQLTAFDDIVTYKEFWQLMTPNLSSNALGCLSGYYRAITIDHTKVGSSDSNNFPVLFAGTYNYLRTVANGGTVTNSNGYDITFTSDTAGTHLLPFERENWNASTGTVDFWVQVPTVSHTTDTVIYLQYGNPKITTDQSNKTGVWDSNYTGVWHLEETSGTQYDSTGYANYLDAADLHFTTQGAAPGVIGGADQLNGSSDGADTYNSNANLMPANFTVQMWVNMSSFDASGDTLAYKIHSATPWQSYELWLDSGHHACLNWVNTSQVGNSACGTTVLSTGTWYSIIGIYNGTNLKVYLNGSNNTSGTVTTSGTMFQSDGPFQLGTANSTNAPHGYFDEVRVSNVVRPDDWIATEYNNEHAPDKATYGASGFYTVGPQTQR